MALRRAKKRNMERLALACGGYAVNSVRGVALDVLFGLMCWDAVGWVKGVDNTHSGWKLSANGLIPSR